MHCSFLVILNLLNPYPSLVTIVYVELCADECLTDSNKLNFDWKMLLASFLQPLNGYKLVSASDYLPANLTTKGSLENVIAFLLIIWDAWLVRCFFQFISLWTVLNAQDVVTMTTSHVLSVLFSVYPSCQCCFSTSILPVLFQYIHLVSVVSVHLKCST